MALSIDVLATTLEDLAVDFDTTFVQWHPWLDKAMKNGAINKNTLKGSFRTFNILTGGPGFVTNINTGGESIKGGRRQNARKGNEFVHRAIYAFDVPRVDMLEAVGPSDLARLIQEYPQAGEDEFKEAYVYQVFTGAALNGNADLQITGIATLNGDTTYNPLGTGARSGLCEFATPATQTATVHGLVSSLGSGWYNQYQTIASYAIEGLTKSRTAYYDANRLAPSYGQVDCMYGDSSSYHNYVDILYQDRRTPKATAITEYPSVMEGVPFEKADYFLEGAIDLTNATYTGGAHAVDTTRGVIYGLKSSVVETIMHGNDGEMAFGGLFLRDKPFRNPTEDSYRFENVLHINHAIRCRRATFAITGAGTP